MSRHETHIVPAADAQVTEIAIFHCDMSRSLGYRWNPVLVRVRAACGQTGWGEVGLAYGHGGSAAMEMVKDLAETFVLGRDARHPARIWDEAYRLGYWLKGGGPLVYGALSGLDIALWDLKGRMLDAPVHELLGGACHDGLRTYANGWFKGCATPEEFAAAARRPVNEGFSAIKFDPFKIAADGTKDRPRPQLDRARLKLAVARMAAVRQAVGDDVEIMIDVHGALGPASAVAAINAFAPYRPAFFEEVTDTASPAQMRKVAGKTSVPLAAGERLYTRFGFQPFVDEGLLDIVQPDVGLAGGITETKKIGDYAETHGIGIQPHNCAGPLLTAATVQVALAMANTCWTEIFPYRDRRACALVTDPLEETIVDGLLPVPRGAGIGVTVDETEVERHECARVG
ncbi:MAG: mandelate racemase/muconate lactonizing enzyme family protein [Roseitalea sp.]|jgi:galactonate dehydratase|nr:mandelate racemase/muconate lactonizing enzyme family protein [Roseitalea sp.]MBO6720370.1 mandelate racemase/muconate lactonizing enzyme family protein [Roseitalea sp.]MBO6742730.1 mandelate racemase/muconate lactonizing enzyme family protein [Roseitalea sp.]